MDSLELAHRINISTDIVTDQEEVIHAQHETIDDKIDAAKNEIIDAIESIAVDLDPVLDAIGEAKTDILTAIDNIDIDLSPIENKLDYIIDTLDGVTYESVMEELNSLENND